MKYLDNLTSIGMNSTHVVLNPYYTKGSIFMSSIMDTLLA
jgi:hypothetical protein